MTKIQKKLFELQDKEYALFQAKLTPTVSAELFIGVRVPACRALAKDLYKNDMDEVKRFLSELPHKYYDENMLHGLLLSEIKDFDSCISELEVFLPFVDNWAVCDIMSPKCFKSHKTELLPHIEAWTKSTEVILFMSILIIIIFVNAIIFITKDKSVKNVFRTIYKLYCQYIIHKNKWKEIFGITHRSYRNHLTYGIFK